MPRAVRKVAPRAEQRAVRKVVQRDAQRDARKDAQKAVQRDMRKAVRKDSNLRNVFSGFRQKEDRKRRLRRNAGCHRSR